MTPSGHYNEAEKEVLKKTIVSIDKLLDKINYYKKLLKDCYDVMSKDEAKKKDTTRLNLLLSIRNEIKELRDK